jgi:hypothetical protein
MTGWKWLALAALLLLLLLASASLYGAMRWSGRTDALLARLEAARVAPRPAVYDERELDGLPPVVQRYFRSVLSAGQPVVAAARVEHRGQFNLGEAADDWKPFTSTQRVVTQRPGFVWDARVAMLPGLSVHVHDAYVAGTGVLHPALAGLVSLATLEGEGEIAFGELMRFFAEAAWYPTALLPSQGVRWEAVDDTSARATLVDGPHRLTLTFGFGADGLMAWVRADARGRTVGGRSVPTPWEGRWSEYRELQGLRVPMSGEVAWLLPEGRKAYWRGTITSLQFEFAP